VVAGGTLNRHALLFATRQLRRVVRPAMRQPYRIKFGPRAGKGIARAHQFQRNGHVFQCGHGRDQVEGLEDHTHIPPAKAGQRIFVHRGQITAKRRDPAAGRALEAPHQHE
jgi:hypothetical protein